MCFKKLPKCLVLKLNVLLIPITNDLSPLGSQQSTVELDKNPSELGQLIDPQYRLLLQSSIESQSPSFTPQGI